MNCFGLCKLHCLPNCKECHIHKPRIIGEDTQTYQKGTIVCSECGLKLKDPEQQYRTSVTERHET